MSEQEDLYLANKQLANTMARMLYFEFSKLDATLFGNKKRTKDAAIIACDIIAKQLYDAGIEGSITFWSTLVRIELYSL